MGKRLQGWVASRLALVLMAVSVGLVAGSCLPLAGSVNQDRNYYACAGPGGVIDPNSLRIDNQPTCGSDKTLQQWTQHGDTSDIVRITATVPEFPGLTVTNSLGQQFPDIRIGWVDVAGAETTMECGYPMSNAGGTDCSALAVRGITVKLEARTGDLNPMGIPYSSTFVGWSGACTGTNPVCTVTANRAIDVTAEFAPVNP